MSAKAAGSGHFFPGGAFQKFVDESLIRLRLLGGDAAELGEEPRSDTDSNQLFGVAGDRPADAAGPAKLFVGGFRNIRKVELVIRRRSGALCEWPDVH